MSEYVVPAEILTAHLEDEAVLLDMRSKNYYRLNGSAAAIWKALEAGVSREELLKRVGGEYAVDPATLEEAFEALCRNLLSRELIVPASGSA